MKKLFLLLLILVSLKTSAYCLISEIFDAVKWGANQINQITDEIFKKNMLVQTAESLATLKKNYEDSMRHYEDLKKIQQNPYGISKEISNQFKKSLNNPVDKFFYEIDRRSYDKKGFIQKGLDSGLDYIKTNWEFAEEVKKGIKDRDQESKKISDKLSSKNKSEVEEAKAQMNLLQYKQFSAIERSLLKLIEIQNKQLERQIWYEEFARNMQDKYFSFAQELEKAKQKPSVSRDQKIKQYIEEIPQYIRPKK